MTGGDIPAAPTPWGTRRRWSFAPWLFARSETVSLMLLACPWFSGFKSTVERLCAVRLVSEEEPPAASQALPHVLSVESAPKPSPIESTEHCVGLRIKVEQLGVLLHARRQGCNSPSANAGGGQAFIVRRERAGSQGGKLPVMYTRYPLTRKQPWRKTSRVAYPEAQTVLHVAPDHSSTTILSIIRIPAASLGTNGPDKTQHK